MKNGVRYDFSETESLLEKSYLTPFFSYAGTNFSATPLLQ